MGLLGREVLGKTCVVKTARTHYIGYVVGYMYKSRNYQVSITQTIQGKMRPGTVITAKDKDVYSI